MNIKSKINLGIAFLFVEFLIIALFGAYSIYHISKQSERIMKDNNLSIGYAEIMLQTIDQINTLQLATALAPAKVKQDASVAGLYERFEEILKKAGGNVTEPGEKELLQVLAGEYRGYKLSAGRIDTARSKVDFYVRNLSPKHRIIKVKIYAISDLNMEAILKKNDRVTQYERRSYVILTVISSVCFLLSIIFIFNFPSIIADPIRRLSEGLKSVSDGNYDVHLNFKANDEFKDMENSVRIIAERLRNYERSNADAFLREKGNAVQIIDDMLEKLRISRERMENLDIKRVLADQANMTETLKNELEKAKRYLHDA